MTEKRIPMETFQVEKICEKCNVGKMTTDGITLLSNPPKYLHTCSECQNQQYFDVAYPYIAYGVKNDQ